MRRQRVRGDMRDRLTLTIAEASQIADARRQVAEISRQLGFDETAQGRVALVVTELAGNLVKHTRHGGELLVWAARDEGEPGIEILALNKGQGMSNVGEALRDGYSTTGTPGTGLGAVQRMSALFDVYSHPDHGTAILSRVTGESHPQRVLPPRVEVGGMHMAKPGQAVSGDNWTAVRHGDHVALLVADGLGHGTDAAIAAGEAVSLFRAAPPGAPSLLVQRLHEGMAGTRGAAIAVANINPDKGEICYAGVGNITGQIVGPGRQQYLLSHNGTVGHAVFRIQEFAYRWTAPALLVMHSDGLASGWTLDAYPGLIRHHPLLIAAVLYRDFSRGRDDSVVVVARATSG